MRDLDDAQDCIHSLSKVTGHQYRLLTEAEREYAARAATGTPYPWDTSASHAHANYGADTCCSGAALGLDRWVETSPAGAFPPNPFGLHDMHGNVSQWVQDCLLGRLRHYRHDGGRIRLPADDHTQAIGRPGEYEWHIARGGNWGDSPAMIRSAFRNYAPPPGSTIPDYKSAGIGFRVARSLHREIRDGPERYFGRFSDRSSILNGAIRPAKPFRRVRFPRARLRLSRSISLVLEFGQTNSLRQGAVCVYARPNLRVRLALSVGSAVSVFPAFRLLPISFGREVEPKLHIGESAHSAPHDDVSRW